MDCWPLDLGIDYFLGSLSHQGYSNLSRCLLPLQTPNVSTATGPQGTGRQGLSLTLLGVRALGRQDPPPTTAHPPKIPMGALFCFVLFLFFETGSLYLALLSWNSLHRPGWPWTKRISCLCPSSARIKAVCHRVQLYLPHHCRGCLKSLALC